jgi:protein-tyrosine phosphatase
VGWISLEGAVNIRDLGGLPTHDGQQTRFDKLIRSENLQGLTDSDVHELIERRRVRTVVDLRTLSEVETEGPGPLSRDRRVEVHHLSLIPEAGERTDVTAAEDKPPVVLPWHDADAQIDNDRRNAASTYMRYLVDRPNAIVVALRLIAGNHGATIVHCAAGKDRTGVVVALALEEVGVDRTAIIEDFIRTGERMKELLHRLAGSPTYAPDVDTEEIDRHRPKAETMQLLLHDIDRRYGGTSGWLRYHDWTDEDAAALRQALLEP